MPHVSIKMIPGRSEDQKKLLAAQIVKNVMRTAECDEQAVSVSIEEVYQEDWTDDVYKKDILPNWKTLYKKPGYNPIA